MEKKTPLLAKIDSIISPMAESMGYEIVRTILLGEGSSMPTLQIMAEIPATGMMPLDDCSRLSQAISAILNVEDVFANPYDLELSSAGIDRPLTRLKDFDRYKNNETRIELDTPVGGQKKFKGMLNGIDGTNILFEDESVGAVSIPFDYVLKAKLLMTDALLGIQSSKPKAPKEHPLAKKEITKKTGRK